MLSPIRRNKLKHLNKKPQKKKMGVKGATGLLVASKSRDLLRFSKNPPRSQTNCNKCWWNKRLQPVQACLLSFFCCSLQGYHSFTDKNPGLFQDAMRNFPGPFRSPQMLKYKVLKEKSPSLSSLSLSSFLFSSLRSRTF